MHKFLSSTNKCAILSTYIKHCLNNVLCFSLILESTSIILLFILGGTTMLKIVHPICCGMDVYKKFIVATVATTSPDGVTSYDTKNFSTFNSSLFKCNDFLKNHNCNKVCMESTGKYWIPIFDIYDFYKTSFIH